jgi:hypothetical protein
MGSRGKVLTTFVVFTLMAAPASAADLRIAETFDDAGDPGLAAFVWDPAAELEWRRCADGGPVCEPLPGTVDTGPYMTRLVAFPGETPAGTVFEAVATTAGVETRVRTRAWQGRVRATSAPTLQGEAAAGKTVTVAQGTWAGGWGPVPELATSDAIYACSNPVGTDCWLIEYGSTVVLDPRWAGWYLFAQERHFAGNAFCHSAFGCSQFAALAAPPLRLELRTGATVARSAPLGPVTAPPPAAAPPPVIAAREVKAPSASIRARAVRRNGRVVVGRVHCETRCTVRLRVSGGNRRKLDRTFRVTGVKRLTAPMRRGKLTVKVTVDGKLVASGRTRYGR